MPGEMLVYAGSAGNGQWSLDDRAKEFSGYIIVECDFPLAHGFAMITAKGSGPRDVGISTSYLARVISPSRSDG